MERIKVTSLATVGEYLLANEICPAEFLRDLGLPPAALLGGQLWLDRDSALRIADRLGRATGDAFPGMHVAEMIDLRNYGLWSARILGSATVGAALQAAADHVGLIESGRMLTLRRDGDRASLETAFTGPVTVNPREYLDASLLLLSRFIGLAAEDIPLEVHFAHARPADTTEIERLMGPNIVFDADVSALILDRDALSVPLDDRKVRVVNSPVASPVSDHARTTANVARTVEEMLRTGRPKAADVARARSINLRTMQRDLAAWGITYEQLLDDILFNYATSALRDERRSVTNVAFDLGYSDSAHFTRAFKRWCGRTPREFRTGNVPADQTVRSLLLKPGDLHPIH